MSGKSEKQSKLAPKHLDAECRLSSLRKRSQTDFEIDFYERILSRQPNYVEVLVCLGELLSEKRLYHRALQVDVRLAALRPKSPTVLYNLACTYALLNQTRKALCALKRASDLGFSDVLLMLDDPDLESLRNHPGFEVILYDVGQRFSGPYVL